MGKGLQVEATGTHVAFTSGTGILPFLDLVALLILNVAEEAGALCVLSD